MLLFFINIFMTISAFENALTTNELSFIDNVVLQNHFPWFYQAQSIPTEKKYSNLTYPFFSHNLMLRAETKNKEPGIINSEHFNFFYNIFKRNCPSFKFLLRMSLNLTFYHDTEYGDIHVDHNFDHSNMIIYLNKFTNGPTYLFDDNFNKTHTIESKYNSGCTFPGNLHAQGFCNIGETRLILITTYV